MEMKWYKKGQILLADIAAAKLTAEQACIWYLGQCGFILKIQDKLIGVDLILNDLRNPEGRTRRNYESPFPPEALTGLDYMLCTHNHRDHLNLETLLPLAAADKKTIFVVPASEIDFLAAGGIDPERITGARHREEIRIAEGLSIIPVAEPHDVYETDKDGNFKSLGYIIKHQDKILYHAGDMVIEDKLVAELQSFGSINVGFLPINGRDWEREQRNIIGNMNPRDAAILANIANVDLSIPTHYDMVQGNCEDPLIFARYMQEHAPGRKYHIMQLGEGFIC